MPKLREQTTIIFGDLGVKLNGYQQQKLEQLKLLKKLKKILTKYWQLANNTEIVYQIMDNISGDLKYKVLLADENVSEEDRALYEQAMQIFKEDVQYSSDLKKYLQAKNDFDEIEKSFVEAGKELTEELVAQKESLASIKATLDATKADLDARKETISARCIEKLGAIVNDIDEITDRIDHNNWTKDDKIKYNYYIQWKKHKQYLLKLNNLGVDIKLTVDVLKADIEMIKEFIEKIQEVIDSFAGGPINPLVAKFNKRLKQFTKRLLEIVEYINTDYPNIEFELNGTEDENNMSNEIFNQDIIKTDEGDASIRHYYDLDKDRDTDIDDVKLLKRIIKLIAKNKVSNPDKTRLIQALDTNGDGVLDKVDLQWLESYVQDAEEREWLEENNPEALDPYQEKEIDEESQAIIDKVTDPNYRGEKFIYVKQSNSTMLPSNNSTDIFNDAVKTIEDTEVTVTWTNARYDEDKNIWYIVCQARANKVGNMIFFVNNGTVTLDKGASFDPTKKVITHTGYATQAMIEAYSSDDPLVYEFRIYYICDPSAVNEETGEIDQTICPDTIVPNLSIVMYNKSKNDKEFVFTLSEIPSIYANSNVNSDLEIDYEAENGNVQLVNE